LAVLHDVRRRVASSGGGEGEYSLYVPGHGHEALPRVQGVALSPTGC
jgi:hypothetical protein